MQLMPDEVMKLLLAILAGGLIGAEREYRDKAAGFRTIIFICVGATVFTILSLKLGGEAESARIAANVVSGVGFLGAGVILRGSGRIVGLTTASTIWLAAAVGMAIGGGYIEFTSIAVGLVLVVLLIFPTLENWIDNLSHVVNYEVVCDLEGDTYENLKAAIKELRLQLRGAKRSKVAGELVCALEVVGRPKRHDLLVAKLLADPAVREFRT